MNIEKYNKLIIHISTPRGKTIGFYLESENIIVTNSQVVSGTREVYVSNIEGLQQFSNVLYVDEIYDLAFLEVPEKKDFNSVKLFEKDIAEGLQIVEIKHYQYLEIGVNNGIISKINKIINNIKYAQIDTENAHGKNKGVIIFNTKNEVVGLNTIILSDDESLDLILPVSYLKEAIEGYQKYKGEFVIRCNYCYNLLLMSNINSEYCSYCGEKMKTELMEWQQKTMSSVEQKIEKIITVLKTNANFLQISENLWEIKEGSAKIRINYNPVTKHIVSYSTLCKLPKENIGEFYEYLLAENSKLKKISFSIKNQDIILSSMYVYDEDLHVDTGYEMFKNLFEKSDYYDDILIGMGGTLI